MTAADPLAWFTAEGKPMPKGSVTRMPNGAMLQARRGPARKQYDDWVDSLKEQARIAAAGHPTLDGPLRVEMEFRLPMPKSRPMADRVRGWAHHTVRPDIDKLARTVLDAMEAADLIVSDARVCALILSAIEVNGTNGTQPPGVSVAVYVQQFGEGRGAT